MVPTWTTFGLAAENYVLRRMRMRNNSRRCKVAHAPYRYTDTVHYFSILFAPHEEQQVRVCRTVLLRLLLLRLVVVVALLLLLLLLCCCCFSSSSSSLLLLLLFRLRQQFYRMDRIQSHVVMMYVTSVTLGVNVVKSSEEILSCRRSKTGWLLASKAETNQNTQD